MNSLFQIDIPKRSLQCFKGQERLSTGSEYYSLLVEDAEKKIIRQDYCPICWNEVKDQLPKGYSHWLSRSEIKQEPVDEQSNRVTRALILLKQLIRQPDANESELFVLALFLAHARKLILRREIEKDGFGYSLYEIAHQDQFVTIKKVALSQLETKSIQQSLATKLSQ
ncbi:MAG: hypothetical protein H0W88_11795 [Parachlamydiaceae bacterium]|nr:hypothetical protein [Parachlamydiaceae bacterium]